MKLHHRDFCQTCWEIFKNHEIIRNMKMAHFLGQFSIKNCWILQVKNISWQSAWKKKKKYSRITQVWPIWKPALMSSVSTFITYKCKQVVEEAQENFPSVSKNFYLQNWVTAGKFGHDPSSWVLQLTKIKKIQFIYCNIHLHLYSFYPDRFIFRKQIVYIVYYVQHLSIRV